MCIPGGCPDVPGPEARGAPQTGGGTPCVHEDLGVPTAPWFDPRSWHRSQRGGRTADIQYTGRPRRANISPPTLAWPINACGLARSTLTASEDLRPGLDPDRDLVDGAGKAITATHEQPQRSPVQLLHMTPGGDSVTLALLTATSPGRTQTTFPTTHITPACSSNYLTRRSHFGHDRRVTTSTQVLRADCHRCCGISTQATLSAADLTLARGGRDLAGTSLTRHLAQLTAITSRGPAHRCRIKLHQGHRRLGFSLGHPT